jgi:hypothetical protein
MPMKADTQTTRPLSLDQVTWCCGIFKGWLEAAGERGVRVVADRDDDGTPAFMIQSRALDLDDDGPKDHPRPLTLISELHIHFCPWCGQRLADVYSGAIQLIARPDLRQCRIGRK